MQSLLVPKGMCDEIEKIARQFIWGSFTDALWVRVLRSKYGLESQLSDSIHRSNCSHLWRSLSKLWPLVCENLLWSVGDGSTIRGWKDPWVPDVGPLLPYVTTHSTLDLGCILKDWVLLDGSWNLYLLRLWLPDELIKRIRLFTDSERARRGIGESSNCPLCGHGTEDILHAIRDCSKAKDAWTLVVPAEKITRINTPASNFQIRLHSAANWVQLFSDRAVARDSRNASAGGVVRDQNARIQTDNLEVVNALSMEALVDLGITILRRIKRLMQFDGQCKITYINRECNLITDQLAKISLSWKLPLQVFEVPPDSVAMTIQQDKAFRIS
ncbi:hypothetical protein J1N35_019277 [Gossypium stocksii]|uniref:Reverse transcriptase zinc-binding domain-containing protein n=1 Tax=Gossypium stocksii TaxID=47602 RepID=A0A9D4A7Z1_9ROSI|nr:hypothetical protein J1N35_019277 [Gossypium stocksii]